jgi:hypothetical protein
MHSKPGLGRFQARLEPALAANWHCSCPASDQIRFLSDNDLTPAPLEGSDGRQEISPDVGRK